MASQGSPETQGSVKLKQDSPQSGSKEIQVGSSEDISRILGKYPELESKRIEELRLIKKEAILKYDYDKSDDVQRYIDSLMSDNTDKVLQAFKQWLGDGVQQALHKYDLNLLEVDEEAEDRELKIRQECELVFRDMQKRHIDELTAIETEREIARLRERSRESADVKSLLDASQRLATVDDVKGAKSLKSEADALKDQQYHQRMEVINGKFDRLIKQAIRKQSSELEGLQRKLDALLEEAESIHESEKIDQQKKAGVYIRFSLHKAITDAAFQLEKKDKRVMVSTELTSFLKKLLKDEKKGFLLRAGE
jgi:hypothetical protein